MRRETVDLAITQKNLDVLRLAERTGGLDQGTKHCFNVESRAADDLQQFRGCGLLLQRFAQFTRSRLLGLEEPHVLERDHRLVCKRGHKGYLSLGERRDHAFQKPEHADGYAV